jgi:hypothetical protein
MLKPEAEAQLVASGQPPSDDKEPLPVPGTAAVPRADEDLDAGEDEGQPTLADELGVQDLKEVLFADRGRIFSAAGRESPIAEMEPDGVLLHPADKPFADGPPGEVINFRADARGVLLDELGQERRIVGAKYKGKPIYTLGEKKPNTEKHYAAWFDENNRPHKLYIEGEALTTDVVYRIRNRTPDGEIGIFSEVTSDP